MHFCACVCVVVAVVQVSWYPGEKAELQALFAGPELPFQFGYAQSGGHGVMYVAWRKQTVTEADVA